MCSNRVVLSIFGQESSFLACQASMYTKTHDAGRVAISPLQQVIKQAINKVSTINAPERTQKHHWRDFASQYMSRRFDRHVKSATKIT